MQHLYTAPVLTRFAAALPGKPFTPDINNLTTSDQLALQQFDPELHSILTGSCPAEVLAQVVSGTLPSSIPTPAERAEQQRLQRVEEIVALNPQGSQGRYTEQGDYIEPVAANMTALLELQGLDPQRYEQLAMQMVTPPPSHQDRVSEQQHLADVRLASMNRSFSGGAV